MMTLCFYWTEKKQKQKKPQNIWHLKVRIRWILSSLQWWMNVTMNLRCSLYIHVYVNRLDSSLWVSLVESLRSRLSSSHHTKYADYLPVIYPNVLLHDGCSNHSPAWTGNNIYESPQDLLLPVKLCVWHLTFTVLVWL